MSPKIRFRFDGRCTRHPRYDPNRDGCPSDGKCEGCESLYVIHLYVKIVKRRAEDAISSYFELRPMTTNNPRLTDGQAINVQAAMSQLGRPNFRFFSSDSSLWFFADSAGIVREFLPTNPGTSEKTIRAPAPASCKYPGQ